MLPCNSPPQEPPRGENETVFKRLMCEYVFMCLAPSFLPSPAVRVTLIPRSKRRRTLKLPPQDVVLALSFVLASGFHCIFTAVFLNVDEAAYSDSRVVKPVQCRFPKLRKWVLGVGDVARRGNT